MALFQLGLAKASFIDLGSKSVVLMARYLSGTQVTGLQFKAFSRLDLQGFTNVDWAGAGSLASNPVFHTRRKHIEVDLHFVKNKVLAQQLDVRYVDSSHQQYVRNTS
uniref:Uncharacterized protein n=1 Tax=Cannabis sativa TaxID=3483 RepID=A0A803NXX9_CANSA